MASPASVFSTGSFYTDGGYDLLLRRFSPAIYTPLIPMGATYPTSVPAWADPTGKFAAGMIPANELSYRTYWSALTTTSADNSGLLSSYAGGIASILGPEPDAIFAIANTRAAVVVFEGVDVIDMPTDGLPMQNGMIQVPHTVFRALHAGVDTLVPAGDTLGTSYWATIAGTTNLIPNNLCEGVAPSMNQPLDVQQTAFNQGRFNTDTASSFIKVKGSPKYISYVGVTRPIFRDVVFLRAPCSATGTSDPSDGFLATQTAGGDLSYYVLRFAYINISQDPKNAQYQWRLSESYGVIPKKVSPIPPGIGAYLSTQDATTLALAGAGNWFAYNLSDLSGADVTAVDAINLAPAGMAYNPVVAGQLMNPSSPYYNKSFSAVVLPWKQTLTSPAPTGEATYIDVQLFSASAGIANSAALEPEYFYSSPIVKVALSAEARLGLEYSASTTGASGVLDYAVLAATTGTAVGLSSVYDASLGMASLFDVVSTAAGECPIERNYSDERWTDGQDTIPSSNLGQYMLGEFPYRSEGRAILLAPQKEVTLPLPGGTVPTAMLASLASPSAGSFAMYAAAGDTTPVQEISFGPMSFPNGGGQTVVALNPAVFTSVQAGGGIAGIRTLYGASTGDVIQPAMTGDQQSSDPVEQQLAGVAAQNFPVQASNMSAASEKTSGFTYLAFENVGRIDMAFRAYYSQPFVLIRDVTLRLPDQPSASAPVFPQPSLPFIVSDQSYKVLYLFYVYKKSLLLKRIPHEMFISEAVAGAQFDVATEKTLAGEIVSYGADFVFATAGLSPLATDLNGGYIRVVDSGGTPPANVTRTIDQYCAFLDATGTLYCFISSGGNIVVRRSANLGTTWEFALTEGFPLYPAPPGAATSSSNSAPTVSLDAPFVLYDPVLRTMLIFFIVGQALMLVKLPGEAFASDADTNASFIASHLSPKLVFGAMTQDMINRGVVPINTTANAVETSNQDSGAGGAKSNTPITATVSTQRITGVITATGHYRIFFRDSQGTLRSLISIDTGDQWFEEGDYSTETL